MVRIRSDSTWMDVTAQPSYECKRCQRRFALRSRNRSSFDSGRVRSSRLRKKRPSREMRAISHAQPLFRADRSLSPVGSSHVVARNGFDHGVKARKPSIRAAVRKMLGRRTRDALPHSTSLIDLPKQSSHARELTSAPGHPHRRSKLVEPAPYHLKVDLPIQTIDFIDQPGTEPLSSGSTPLPKRAVSPYAVQFQNSVRLKPLDLSHHLDFSTQQLRRTKTLPGVLRSEQNKECDRASTGPGLQENPELMTGHSSSTAVQSNLYQTRDSRRKSRSTDGMFRLGDSEQSASRQRSEEIKHLRESLQPNVTRIGSCTRNIVKREGNSQQERSSSPGRETDCSNVARPDMVEKVGSVTFVLPSDEPSPHGAEIRPDTSHGRLSVRDRQRLSVGESQCRPLSDTGTGTPKDLEERVAKLETGLQDFQQSIQELSAERNRRNVVLGGSDGTRSSTDTRTPSLLADTLSALPHQNRYGEALRPATASKVQNPPPGPAQVGLVDPFRPGAVVSGRPTPSSTEFSQLSPSVQSHSPVQQLSGPSSSAPKGQLQPYVFSSLYQMLADERSARRKLESQLRNLRQELSDLHMQVMTSSPSQGNRSSYLIAGSSSRLQNLLRETESSPPRTSSRAIPTESDLSDSSHPTLVISRFSASESEAGLAIRHNDQMTPSLAELQRPLEHADHYGPTEHEYDLLDDEDVMF